MLMFISLNISNFLSNLKIIGFIIIKLLIILASECSDEELLLMESQPKQSLGGLNVQGMAPGEALYLPPCKINIIYLTEDKIRKGDCSYYMSQLADTSILQPVVKDDGWEAINSANESGSYPVLHIQSNSHNMEWMLLRFYILFCQDPNFT